MERKRNIVESINAPQPHDLWIHNGELKYYGPSGWTPFGSSNEGVFEIIEDKLSVNVTDGSLDALTSRSGFTLVKEDGLKVPYLRTNLYNTNRSTSEPILMEAFVGFGCNKDKATINILGLYNMGGSVRVLKPLSFMNLGAEATESSSGLMPSEDKTIVNQLKSFNQESSNSPFIIGDSTNADILDTEIIMTLGQNDNKTNLWVVLVRCNETEDQTLQLKYNNNIISEKKYHYNSFSGNALSELLLWTVSLPANAAQGSCSIQIA